MWSLSNVLWSIVFCFSWVALCVYAEWVYEDDGCRTPDGSSGNCMPVTECQPMLDALKKVKRPISNTVLKHLQAYTCGPLGSNAKVCCPPGPISIEPPRITETRNGPPDVSSHRNLHLLPQDCGYLNTNDRIINGEDAALNEFPWMALLRYKKRKGLLGFDCGGTVINKNYILTAAHCITGLKTSELISVRVGEHSIKNETDCERIKKTVKCNPPVQDVVIEQVIPHPSFSLSAFLNDIGLLRVSTMDLNVENVRAVCLPLGKDRTKHYEGVFVTGWGITNTNTGETSDILQKVRLPVANKTACANTYQTHKISLTDKQLCAGGAHNKDSCPGDSGQESPIPCFQGIVSFGPKYCGIPGYPGVYTLVNHYMDWILDNLKP